MPGSLTSNGLKLAEVCNRSLNEARTNLRLFCCVEGYLIGLEDILSGMRSGLGEETGAMDVKLGRLSYMNNAPPTKVAIEESKYLYRRQVGFFITGIRVSAATNYNQSTHNSLVVIILCLSCVLCLHR